MVVQNLFAKMKGKDELEGTRSIFTPWQRDFEHQGENCWGVVATPFGEVGLIFRQFQIRISVIVVIVYNYYKMRFMGTFVRVLDIEVGSPTSMFQKEASLFPQRIRIQKIRQ